MMKKSTPTSVWIVVILFITVAPAAGQLIQSSYACYGSATLSCTAHQVACGAGSRVYPLAAAYGYKPSFQGCFTYYNICPGVTSSCCQRQAQDCMLGYSVNDWARVLTDCWAASNSCANQAAWSRSGCSYNNVNYGLFSSYSALSYICVSDAASTEFYSTNTVNPGSSTLSLTYTSSGRYGELEEEDDVSLWQCYVEAADCAPTQAEVYMVMQLSRYTSGTCSTLGVSRNSLLPCSSVGSYRALTIATPFSAFLALSGNALPSTAGIAIMALDGSPLLVRCGYDYVGTPTSRCSAPTTPAATTTPGATTLPPSTPPVPTSPSTPASSSSATSTTPTPSSPDTTSQGPEPLVPTTEAVATTTTTNSSEVTSPGGVRETTTGIIPEGVEDPDDDARRSARVGLIAGIAVVALFILLALALVVVYCCRSLARKQEPEDSDNEDSITNMVRSSTLSQVELCKVRSSGASETSAELHNVLTSSSSPSTTDSSPAIYVSTGYYSLDSMKGGMEAAGDASASPPAGTITHHGLSLHAGSSADNPYFEPYDSRLTIKAKTQSASDKPLAASSPKAERKSAYTDVAATTPATDNMYSEVGMYGTGAVTSSPNVTSDPGYLQTGLRLVPRITVEMYGDERGSLLYENSGQGATYRHQGEGPGGGGGRGSAYTSMHCPDGMSVENLFQAKTTQDQKPNPAGNLYEAVPDSVRVQAASGGAKARPPKPVPKKRHLKLDQLAAKILSKAGVGRSKETKAAAAGRSEGHGEKDSQHDAAYDHLGVIRRPDVAKATEGDATYGHLGEHESGAKTGGKLEKSGGSLYSYDRLNRGQRVEVVQDAIYSTPLAPPEKPGEDNVYSN